MANKNINARVALKHDIEENWITAGEHDFCPMAGEVIIYDIQEGVCSQLRYKIGRKDSNGQLININDLPFESNVYVGRDEPVNAPAGFIWVDTSDEPEEEERLEGDGQEFYTTAPSSLSFRSTAPLNELQEIQINGQIVDPSKYTLEEGSTIVKLKYDYLGTLDTGKYEVAVVSDSKTVKGNFTVASPDLNQYGFYYNLPYRMYLVNELEPDDKRLLDTFLVKTNDDTFSVDTETGGLLLTDTIFNFIDGICEVSILGMPLQGSFSSDGTTFTSERIEAEDQIGYLFAELSLDIIAADSTYMYIKSPVFDSWSVTPLYNNEATYTNIKSNIANKPVVAIAEDAFAGNTTLSTFPLLPATVIRLEIGAFSGCTDLANVKLPDQITIIGDSCFDRCSNLVKIIIPTTVNQIGFRAFADCGSLQDIIYNGTQSQWNEIVKILDWNYNIPATYVHCTDGDVAL